MQLCVFYCLCVIVTYLPRSRRVRLRELVTWQRQTGPEHRARDSGWERDKAEDKKKKKGKSAREKEGAGSRAALAFGGVYKDCEDGAG